MRRPVLLTLVGVVVVALLAGGSFAYYRATTGAGANGNSTNNTYLTSCTITGIGGLEFRVLSDSGAPVPLWFPSNSSGASSGARLTAVDHLGCNEQTQVVYIDSFSESQGGRGWLTPDFPGNATPAGRLDFAVLYGGTTYTFTTTIPPIGTNCVTFHVPSGTANSTTVMNGSGSYCS